MAILFWLCVWEFASRLVGQEILLASPGAALKALVRLGREPAFYRTIATSFARVATGFLLGTVAGILLALAAQRSRLVRLLLETPMQAVRAAPVASFIILALVWFSSRRVSIFIAFLMVLPTIYLSTLSGLESADRQLLEMARVFGVSKWRVLIRIRFPAAARQFFTACRLCLSMSWKAGIAAEVIGQSDHTIGDALYRSKLFLMTDELFAWTLVIVLLSVLFEKVALRGLNRLGRRLEG